MTLFIIVVALSILMLIILYVFAYLLEGKIIQDYQRELDKYGIDVELEHRLGEPWEVDGE